MRGIEMQSFLDVGTGSDILAVAACKLGFISVTGVDIDPLAVNAAIRNVRLNCSGGVEIKAGSIEDIEDTFDMVVANLMSEVLLRIAPEIVFHLNIAGIAISPVCSLAKKGTL